MAEKWAELALLFRLRKGPRRVSVILAAMALLALVRAVQAQATQAKRGGWFYPVHLRDSRGNRQESDEKVEHHERRERTISSSDSTLGKQ